MENSKYTMQATMISQCSSETEVARVFIKRVYYN